MGKKKVTIKDIAQYAGVSAMTVSYVLNKNPNQTISEATTQKVLDAVRELHYIPSTTAKALRSNQTCCIGVLLDQAVNHQRYAQTLDGIRSALEQNDYNILLCSSTPKANGFPEYINCFLQHKVDGLIYIGRDGISIPADELQLIAENNIPVTSLDCECISSGISTVEFDYYHGALSHASYLIENNAKNILYLRPENETLQERERESGLRNTLFRHPEITLSIEKIPDRFTDLLTAKAQKHENRELFSYLRSLVREHGSALSSRDAIMCSWGIYVEPVYAEAMAICPTLQIASLAAGNLSVDNWPNLSYSMLPSFQAGSLCAELIIHQITHSAVKHERLETYIEHSK